MSRSKRNRKKAMPNRKRHRKASITNTERKNIKNNCEDDDHNGSVERSKLMCRRYEEFHDHFLDYDKILKFLEKVQKCNPSSMDLIKIGNSTQGKPIYMVYITTSCGNSTHPKMAVLIEAGLNGQNAIAVSNTLFMIEFLTKNPNYLKIMDYCIIPCCNPDAYDEFIKNKQKESKDPKKPESYCKIDKKTAQTDISKSESPPHTGLKSKKPSSKRAGCSSASEWDTNPKKSCSDSFTSDEKEDSLGDPSDAENSTNSRSASLMGGKSHKKGSCSKTSEKNKKQHDDKKRNPSKSEATSGSSTGHQGGNTSSTRMDLSLNFPVVLGINDMSRIPTGIFLEKIKKWKENFSNQAPETRALLNAIYSHQFVIRLLISLQEEGEAICFPYGFCAGTDQDTNDLKEVAKKGKSAICGRNFQYGSVYDIQGLTYGSLVDFLKIEKCSIKYMYVIKVHKKTPRYTEKEELRQLMRYGGEIMDCVKRMSCAVFKCFTDMTGNKKVETESTKPSIDKRTNF